MAITITPITIQEQTKTYSQVWVHSININSDNPKKPVMVYFSSSPYCPDDQSCLRDQMQHVNIDDLFSEVSNDPSGKLGQAVASLYDAIQEILTQRGLFGLSDASGSLSGSASGSVSGSV